MGPWALELCRASRGGKTVANPGPGGSCLFARDKHLNLHFRIHVVMNRVVTVKTRWRLSLAQRLERRPDLLTEQFRHFPGGEVAALGSLVEVGEGGVALLDPAAGSPEDLVGEGGVANRDRDLW